MVLDDDLLQLMAFGALYDRALIEQLPYFIGELDAGRIDQLAQLIATTLADELLPPGNTPGAFFSGDCADDVAFTEGTDDPIELANPDVDSCGAWAVAPGELGNDPITSDVPTLVLAGAFDSVTPPTWSEAQAERMANATYVEFPYFGHSIITSTEPEGCARQIRLDFLTDPEAELDIACAADQEQLAFRLS
jgi:pimeloyl-ACP methyl ester carboxylesterase